VTRKEENMKRLHVHVSVKDLEKSVGFYSALFAAKPDVVKPDYAKWMLDDPRVNFAISMRGNQPGLDHLGIQVESSAELHDVYGRLHQAGSAVLEVGPTTCCYAQSEKSWIDDPTGIAWETFLTSGGSTVYGDSSKEKSGEARIAHPRSCCAPQPEERASCCTA
jgi:catechol 2,3-dioxygenase-like lactoylglutathione lyase family enzyme